MKLEYYKDYICVKDCDKPNITISKDALERLRDEFIKLSDKVQDADSMASYLYGKVDLLQDLLKLFDDEIPL